MFMWTRDTHSSETPKKGFGAMWFAIPVAVFLFVVAWHYGIVASITLVLKDVFVIIWNMLLGVAGFIRDSWQCVLRQRQ